MFRNFLVFIAILSLAACKKETQPQPEDGPDPTFDHEVTAPLDCPDCAAANSREGIYRGFAGGAFVPGGSDSLTVVVEHVFQNKGVFIDSVKMFLKMGFKYDNQPDTLHYVFTVRSNGYFNYGGGSYFTNDRMIIYATAPTSHGSVPGMLYTGIKQP